MGKFITKYLLFNEQLWMSQEAEQIMKTGVFTLLSIIPFNLKHMLTSLITFIGFTPEFYYNCIKKRNLIQFEKMMVPMSNFFDVKTTGEAQPHYRWQRRNSHQCRQLPYQWIKICINPNLGKSLCNIYLLYIHLLLHAYIRHYYSWPEPMMNNKDLLQGLTASTASKVVKKVGSLSIILIVVYLLPMTNAISTEGNSDSKKL